MPEPTRSAERSETSASLMSPLRPSSSPASSSIWPQLTEDRVRAGMGVTIAVALLLGASFWMALATLDAAEGGALFVNAAVATAVLAVLALRSIPLRWVVRSYAAIGAVLLGRFGVMGTATGVAAATDVLLWALVTAAALALCPSPAPRSARQPSSPWDGGAGGGPVHGSGGWEEVASTSVAPAGRSPRDPAAIVRAVLAGSVAVLAVMALVGPIAPQRSPVAPSNGRDPDQFDRGQQNAMSFQERLDMTSRPRLTDTVVMTVRSDIVSFWRTATYDTWDGSSWTGSDGGSYRLLGPGGTVFASPEDLAARSGEESRQEFRLQSRFANALPVAPSASVVESDAQLIQRPDGSVLAPDALGEGARYTVTSRQMDVTAADLEAIDDPVPGEIADRYAARPDTSGRVRDLARRIVDDAGAETELAKVQALEAWMGDHLKYSLDAPLAPPGVDVVDDFLFESKVGWCEQIASSLVVMLREVGVPARLAVGFAPGEQDGNSGGFVVRERDAHAWAEVWFPTVGWVPFDPTAEVPLSGDAATSTELPIGFAGLAVVLLFIGAIAVVAAPLARRLHAWRERRAVRRAAKRLAAERWDVRVEQELEEIGREVGRPRAPSETVSCHARELAVVTGRPELAEQGAAVDDHRYSPPTP